VVLNKKENFTLSYASSKVEENKLANKATDYNLKDREQLSNTKVTTLNNIPILQGKSVGNNNLNMHTPQEPKMSFISYKNYQPAELNSWNGKTHSLSIFGTNRFLDIDSKNFSISLL